MNTTSILNALNCDNVPKVQHENELANTQVIRSLSNGGPQRNNDKGHGEGMSRAGASTTYKRIETAATPPPVNTPVHVTNIEERQADDCPLLTWDGEFWLNKKNTIQHPPRFWFACTQVVDDMAFLDDENYGAEQ